jgi:hypothetical protein
MKRHPDIGKPEGIYSNYFKIGHNFDVVVIDHYQVFLEDSDTETNIVEMANHKVRIITTPSDAKQLMDQLKFSIEAYEKDYGPVPKPKPD